MTKLRVTTLWINTLLPIPYCACLEQQTWRGNWTDIITFLTHVSQLRNTRHPEHKVKHQTGYIHTQGCHQGLKNITESKITLKYRWNANKKYRVSGKLPTKITTQKKVNLNNSAGAVKNILVQQEDENSSTWQNCIQLKVNFDSLQAVSLHWDFSAVLGHMTPFTDLNEYTSPVFYWYHIVT